jgi:NADP-dependent 3-hydroxy acid dehydrogenase YdfG
VRIGEFQIARRVIPASIAAVIAVNLTGVILGRRRVAATMRRQRSGTIMNTSSVAGHDAWPAWGVYGAAKAGLNHFADRMRRASVPQRGGRWSEPAPCYSTSTMIA